MTAHEQETIFRRWLEQHLGLMLKVVRGCTEAPADQEDLFQEVLLALWLSLPKFRGEARETTWIYRVAFNTALAWRRGEQRRRTGQAHFLQWDAAWQAQPEPVAANPQAELINHLYAAIRQLPKVEASLALMHLDGLSYKEMAEVLGISENYIGVKLNRIRKQLVEQLKGVLHEL